jgi:hypothetical protein
VVKLLAPAVVWRFVGELANCSDGAVSVTLNGTPLEGLPAVSARCNITGFNGVYIVLYPTGSVVFKAQLSKNEGATKSLTKTFSLTDFSLNEAYAHAVKERSVYLGLNISIPKLKDIKYKEAYDFICSKYGPDWIQKPKASGFKARMAEEAEGLNITV